MSILQSMKNNAGKLTAIVGMTLASMQGMAQDPANLAQNPANLAQDPANLAQVLLTPKTIRAYAALYLLDANLDGKVSKQEYLDNLLVGLKQLVRDDLESNPVDATLAHIETRDNVFKKLDKNKDGYLSNDELGPFDSIKAYLPITEFNKWVRFDDYSKKLKEIAQKVEQKASSKNYLGGNGIEYFAKVEFEGKQREIVLSKKHSEEDVFEIDLPKLGYLGVMDSFVFEGGNSPYRLGRASDIADSVNEARKQNTSLRNYLRAEHEKKAKIIDEVYTAFCK